MVFFRSVFLCAAVVVGLAAADTGLTGAEQIALANAQALIASLKPKVDRLARQSVAGPTVSAVGGSIVQSVGAGNNAVIKIGGLDAMTVSSTDTAISEDGVVVESSVTQTIGTASIKVQGDDVIITGPGGAGDFKFVYGADGEMASINGIYAEMENSSATLTKLIADGAAATTEAAEVASAAVDLKFAVAAENAANDKASIEGKLEELEASVTDIVEPSIAAVKLEAAATAAAASEDRAAIKAFAEATAVSLKGTQNQLLGISSAFPGATCAVIKAANANAADGLFWIKSKLSSTTAIQVYCKTVSGKFVSVGGNGATKGEAGAGCFASPLLTTATGMVWVDPDANAEDPSNAKQQICGDGKGPTSAALTCKGIKNKYTNAANGLYWVVGRKEEYKASPKQVYCWNADRDGGGWTLILVAYYCGHQRPSFSGTGEVTTGDIKRGTHWLENQPGVYKMHDEEIRAVIGQPDHKNKAKSATASKFSYMMDQSGWNGYYAGSNREYIINKDYTARWRFYRFQGIDESTTTTTMTAYAWDNHYNGRNTAMGDGSINWVGRAKCGNNKNSRPTGAGISCRGAYSGTPSSSLRGGRGCHRNLGYDRWHGDLHAYMCETNHDTYLYMCNGPQHSSNCRFATRTWIRTADEDTVA